MSSPFIKRAKSRSNIRQRDGAASASGTSSPLAGPGVTAGGHGAGGDAEADDGDGESSGVGMSPMALAQQRKKEKDRKRSGLSGASSGRTRLSFGGAGEEGEDGDSPAFVPRKSTLSQSVSLQKLANANAALESPASAGPSRSTLSGPAAASPSYSAAYLDELKAATPTRQTGRGVLDDQDEDVDMSDGPAEANGGSGSGLSALARAKYGDVKDTTAGIPDEAHVAAAKARRRAALENGANGAQGGEEDFIALTEGHGKVAVYDADEEGKRRSRRDSDDDDEELDSEDEKTALGRKANKAAARRLKSEIVDLIDERENEDLDNEDELEWAQAQAARANLYGRADENAVSSATRSYRSAPIPATRPLPTVSAASARLQTALTGLQTEYTERESQIAKSQRDLDSFDVQEQELRTEVANVEAKKEWIEEFRGWVEALGGFLEEKFPLLEDIEADINHHYAEREAIVSKRRAEDDADDLAMFLGVPAQAEQNGDEAIDDLGRSRPRVDDSGAQSGVRRYRRQDRQARRDRRRSTRPPQQEDGFSTDSTLGEADAADYQDAQDALQKRATALSANVKAEDFRDPRLGIAQRFGGWRDRYTEEYSNAYGGLALVQAWEYWARSEMITWEPTRHATTLDSFSWYHGLHDYSRIHADGSQEDQDMDDAELGPDGDLVPPMVSSAVVPIIVKAFESGAYDVYSGLQTRRVVDLVDMVSSYVGKDNAKVRGILKAVVTLMLKNIDGTISLVQASSARDASPPPAFDPSARTALAMFTRRRLKLIRNMLLWRRFAPTEIAELIKRIVAETLTTPLVKNWDSGGQALADEVLKAIPSNILPRELATPLQIGPYHR